MADGETWMSEKVENAADAKLAEAMAKLKAMIPPGFSVERNDQGPGREDYAIMWKDGEQPRSAVVAILDLGEQFNLAELTGAVSTENTSWQNMAYIAASVHTLDGVPVPAVWTKKEFLRGTLTKLGMNGFRGVSLVVNGYRGGDLSAEATAALGEAETKAVVKN